MGAAPQPSTAPKTFLPPKAGKAADAASQPPSGMLAAFYFWVAQKQNEFSRTLAAALRDIKQGNALGASMVLIFFSFLYGVLHAAGPGHGKAIVSSYMLADHQTVRRGIWLAFLSSAIQALSAIMLFAVVVLALRGARTEIVNTETSLERASWAIVALFGGWLLFRQLRALLTGRPLHDHGHDHHTHDHAAHEVGHRHAHGDQLHHVDAHTHTHDHSHHGHAAHPHSHGPGEACETCGHAHMPTAEALQGAWSWRRALTLAFAVGIRPCTGAVGVLFVANGLGLMWAGVIATFVMAVGTAITVSTLATLAVSSRDLATRLAGTSDNSWATKAQTAFGLAGAALVFLLGSTFFYYSLITPAPL